MERLQWQVQNFALGMHTEPSRAGEGAERFALDASGLRADNNGHLRPRVAFKQYGDEGDNVVTGVAAGEDYLLTLRADATVTIRFADRPGEEIPIRFGTPSDLTGALSIIDEYDDFLIIKAQGGSPFWLDMREDSNWYLYANRLGIVPPSRYKFPNTQYFASGGNNPPVIIHGFVYFYRWTYVRAVGDSNHKIRDGELHPIGTLFNGMESNPSPPIGFYRALVRSSTAEAPAQEAQIRQAASTLRQSNRLLSTPESVWNRYADSVWRRDDVFPTLAPMLRQVLASFETEDLGRRQPGVLIQFYLGNLPILDNLDTIVPKSFIRLVAGDRALRQVFEDADVIGMFNDEPSVRAFLALVEGSSALAQGTTPDPLPEPSEVEPPETVVDVFNTYRTILTAEPLFSLLLPVLRLMQTTAWRPTFNSQTVRLLFVDEPNALFQLVHAVPAAFTNLLKSDAAVKAVFADADVLRILASEQLTGDLLVLLEDALLERGAPAAPPGPGERPGVPDGGAGDGEPRGVPEEPVEPTAPVEPPTPPVYQDPEEPTPSVPVPTQRPTAYSPPGVTTKFIDNDGNAVNRIFPMGQAVTYGPDGNFITRLFSPTPVTDAYNIIQFDWSNLWDAASDPQVTGIMVYQSEPVPATGDGTYNVDALEYRRIDFVPRTAQFSFTGQSATAEVWAEKPQLRFDNNIMPDTQRIHLYHDRIFVPTASGLRFSDIDGTVLKLWAFPEAHAISRAGIHDCVSHRGALLFGGPSDFYVLTGTGPYNFQVTRLGRLGPVSSHAMQVLRDSVAFVGASGFFGTDGVSVQKLSEALNADFEGYETTYGHCHQLPDDSLVFVAQQRHNTKTPRRVTYHFDGGWFAWPRFNIHQMAQWRIAGVKVMMADLSKAVRELEWEVLPDVADDDASDAFDLIDWHWESQRLNFGDERLKSFRELQIEGQALSVVPAQHSQWHLTRGQPTVVKSLGWRLGDRVFGINGRVWGVAEVASPVRLTIWVDDREPHYEVFELFRDEVRPVRIPINRKGKAIRFRLEGRGHLALKSLKLVGGM